MNDAIVATSRRRPVFLDVSGVLRHGRNSPHGIPRVEAELARHLVRDPRVVPVWFDFAADRFVRLNAAERAYLEELLADDSGNASTGRSRASWLTRIYLDRRRFRGALAARLVDPKSRSLGARAVREAVRAAAHVGYFAAAAARFGGRLRGSASAVGREPGDRDGLLLLAERNTQHVAAAARVTRPVRIVHDLIPIEFPQFFNDPARFLLRFRACVRACPVLIGISEATCGRVEQWLAQNPIDGRRPIVRAARLPGFLHEKAQAARWPDAVARFARPFILYCATIDPRKNHAIILDAYQRLLTDHGKGGPEPPDLVFVGRWVKKGEGLRTKLTSDARFAGRVHVLTDVGDWELRSLYERALFTVFPSFREGWGLGAAESLDFGTPVLVSTDDALVEASQGLMPAIEPSDPVAWYEGMRRLAFSEADREELRKRIRERYVHRSVADFAARIMAILDLADEETPSHKLERAPPQGS